MKFIFGSIARIVVLFSIPISGEVAALSTERDSGEESGSTASYCAVFSKSNQYRRYRNINFIENPELADVGAGELRDGGRRLHLNRYYCDRFFSKDYRDRLVAARNDIYWYDKSEFLHESELIPVDHWRTRYIYSKSNLSYVGSELMLRKEEIELDRLVGYDAYMFGGRHEGLYQFSDDGYYLDRKLQIRWRIMYVPEPSSEGSARAAGAPQIFLIDESGRYLPRGLPGIGGYQYRFNCERMNKGGVSCGYGPRDPIPVLAGAGDDDMKFNGAIRDISPEFTPLKIEADRVTITRRLSHGEKFWLDDQHEIDVNNFFFYADFDDPIRPVYFAPGVLLRDRPKGYQRAPSKEDFINREVCLTDCPSDIEWQLSGIRKRIEAHP